MNNSVDSKISRFDLLLVLELDKGAEGKIHNILPNTVSLELLQNYLKHI